MTALNSCQAYGSSATMHTSCIYKPEVETSGFRRPKVWHFDVIKYKSVRFCCMGTFACIQYRYIALKNGTSVVLSQLAFNISYKTHFNEGLMKAKVDSKKEYS